MKAKNEAGLKIVSDEFQLLINDALNFPITNVYLNRVDVDFNSKEYRGPIERYKTLKSRMVSIVNGVILEFNNNRFYEFSGGIGICDYFLKVSKPSEFPIHEKYVNVKQTDIQVLKWLINKSPSNIIPTTCHDGKTVLKGLEFWNHDKTKFSILGRHFGFEDELGNYEFYDGAWVLIDNKAIEKMKYK